MLFLLVEHTGEECDVFHFLERRDTSILMIPCMLHVAARGQPATFTHDALKRRTGASYADGSTMSFAFDSAGRLIQASDSVGGTILNQYDVLDRLRAQATGLGIVGYEYDALGRRTRMDVPGQDSVTYGYDAASRLTAITKGPQVVGLVYDVGGRRTRLILPNGVATEYQYDSASRLTALIYRNALGTLGELTYQYDSAGNRTGIAGSFARTLLPDPISSASYNAANRRLTFGSQTLTYDLNGNLSSDGTTSYTWDARNRLTALAAPSATATFAYDPLGRRHVKAVNGAATYALYDGHDFVTELTDAPAMPYLRTLGVDEPLARGMGEFYLADALGTILALTGQDGTVTTGYTYTPFGTTVADNPTALNPFQFTGRENDGTGLYYYRARYYSPLLHRFVSEDPLGLLVSVNAYSYALNDPVSFADPSGLDVTVRLYEGAGSLGHIGVAVNSEKTVGFYPAENSFRMLRSQDVPGIYMADRRQRIETITIPTSPAQDRLMQDIITRALTNPPPQYNLRGNNCSNFVADVLRAGGLQVPNTNLPHQFRSELRDRYGSPREIPPPRTRFK